MHGETRPGLLPPMVHRALTPGGHAELAVKPLEPWTSAGRTTATESHPAPQPQAEPLVLDEPVDEPDLDISEPQPGETAFPFERGPAARTEEEPLSPWESFGKAVQESVSWDNVAEVAPEPETEPWDPSGTPVEEWAPAPAPAGTASAESADAMAEIARRLEAFAAELRNVGYPAVTRGLTRDRFEAALASLIAGYVAASRTD